MDNKSPEAFRTISEVADWLGVPAHVLRFWESRFGQVKPVKRAGGRRYYRPSDMELLGGIRKLLHDDGMTIRGVQKLLRENGVKHVAAMSPPIDQPADLRDVSPQDAAAHTADPDRAAPVFVNDVDDAVEVEAAAETPAPRETPAETGSGADQDTPEEETADAAMFAAADEADEAETSAPEAEDVKPVFAGAPVPSENETGEDAAEDASAETPLDGPDAIDFFAHEAQPETVEQAGPPDDFVPDIARDADAPADASVAEVHSADDTTDATAPVRADAGPFAESEPETPDVATEEAARQPDDAAEPAELPTIDTSAPDFAGDVPVSRPETAPQDRSLDETAPDEPRPDAQSAPEGVTPRLAETPTSAEPTEADAAAEDATTLTGPDSTEQTAPGIETAPAPAEPDVATPDPEAAHAELRDAAAGETDPHTAAPREPDAPAPEAPAAEPAEPAPAAPERPDLVMPDIGPDPEDDAGIQASPALAAALRRQRPHAGAAASARLNPALLQAYADRLQALSGRLGATPDGRRPF